MFSVKHRPRKVLTVAFLVILTFVVCIAALVGFLVLALRDFALIPQDCLLIQRQAVGTVTDADGKSIPNATVLVSAGLGKGFEAGRIDLHLVTDTSGRFTVPPSDLFACDYVSFTVSAMDYRGTRASFLAEPGLLQSMPDVISFVLERTP